MNRNIIMMSDSYKYSHFEQYPNNMIGMFDYAEARSGKVYPETVFFGLQYFIKEYLMKPFDLEDVLEAQDFADTHGIPFNKEGWIYILENYDGALPVKIRSVAEGLRVPTKNVLFTVESTDTKVPWVAGFLETLLMKVWYSSNIATRSYYVKEMMKTYWEKTVDDTALGGIDFAFHNFGSRGSSSVEAAGIGGLAHLTQFKGTDNFDSLRFGKEYYSDSISGFSIPATEHSSTTAWGKENEMNMILNHIENNTSCDIIAAVCDSYDYLATVDKITSGDFKEKIEDPNYPKFIIRPDSGEPLSMVAKTLDIMEENGVSFSVNTKGYKVFDKYGIIWGDGIDMEVMENLLILLVKRGYAASNIAFGSGGWLMQQHDRDTQGWAVKCSSIIVDEGAPIDDSDGSTSWETFPIQRDVFKSPITAPNKKSKKGKLTLWLNNESGEYFTEREDFKTNEFCVSECLNTVYINGEMPFESTLEMVRSVNG